MTTITGMALDYDKMLADKWTLYFTEGVYEGDRVLKSIAPAIMRLKMSDYAEQDLEMFDVFIEPLSSEYTLAKRTAGTEIPDNCTEQGIHLGGFLVDGCQLRFTYPISDEVEYIRPYEDDAFDDGFIDIDEIVPVDEDNYTSFNFDFDLNFQTGAMLPKPGDPENGAFAVKAFDTSFDNLTNIPQ